MAFDCTTPAMRDALHAALRDNGVLVGVNGTQSIRFRPALTFGPQHVAEFESVLGVARGKFLEFKGWKQNELKRKAGLF